MKPRPLLWAVALVALPSAAWAQDAPVVASAAPNGPDVAETGKAGPEWRTVTSADGRLSVDLPCNPHHMHGHSRMAGIDQRIESEELFCLKSTGFAATGGAMSFEVYRSSVPGDQGLTRTAFERGIAARPGARTLPGFPADRAFWSADIIKVMTRQRVGCKWGMEFLQDGLWWTAIISTPRSLCAGQGSGRDSGMPSATALRFFNSVRVSQTMPMSSRTSEQ